MSTATSSETPMRRQKDRTKGDGSVRAAQTEAIPASPISHAEIAERAYEIFVARGCEDGRDLDDWLTAERELLESDEVRRAEAPSRLGEREV